MVRVELYKLFRRKLVWVVFLGILILIAVAVFYYNSYDFKNYRELQEEMALFEKYQGTLTDERLDAYFEEYTLKKYDYMGELFIDEQGKRREVDSVYQKCHFPIQFGYFEGWAFFLDDLPKYIKYIPVFVAVAFAALFTYERECGMLETLLCAKRGRKECVQAKIAGAFLVTNALYLYSIVLPCLVYFLVHRGNGMETSIQMTPWLRDSQLNMNYITLFFHTIFLSFIVINAILMITLIVSYYVKSPMTAMCIILGILYLLRPDIMSVSLNSEIANKITALTPVNAVDTVNLAKQMPVRIGEMTIQWLTVAEILYSVLLVGVSIFFFLVIGKRQKCD